MDSSTLLGCVTGLSGWYGGAWLCDRCEWTVWWCLVV